MTGISKLKKDSFVLVEMTDFEMWLRDVCGFEGDDFAGLWVDVAGEGKVLPAVGGAYLAGAGEFGVGFEGQGFGIAGSEEDTVGVWKLFFEDGERGRAADQLGDFFGVAPSSGCLTVDGGAEGCDPFCDDGVLCGGEVGLVATGGLRDGCQCAEEDNGQGVADGSAHSGIHHRRWPWGGQAWNRSCMDDRPIRVVARITVKTWQSYCF